MIAKAKQKLVKTKLFKTLLWFKYTREIGLHKELSNPSSTKSKQLFIKKIAHKYSLNILIETGTYLGDMVYANVNNFKKIYSIELDRKLHHRAKKRFEKFRHVRIIHGDSAHVLRNLVNKIYDKVLFWLDAHYSGGITTKGKNNTPIEQELRIILHKWKNGSVIIIDDARLFTGINGYPKIEAIRKIAIGKNLKTKVFQDMIVIK